MSYTLTISGHVEGDQAEVDAFADKIAELAKEAEVGVTRVSYSGPNGARTLYDSYQESLQGDSEEDVEEVTSVEDNDGGPDGEDGDD